MGYTNDWHANVEQFKKVSCFPNSMLDELNNVIQVYTAMREKTGKPIDITKFIITPTEIHVHGPCESFDVSFKKHPTEGIFGVDSWTFCKTEREPYDAVIKCFIMIFMKYGFFTRWSHDDYNSCAEYRKAVYLAKKCGIWHKGDAKLLGATK